MIKNFSYGLAPIMNKVTGKWGYIDVEYKLVIPFQYDEVLDFNIFGHASVKIDGHWGMINRKNHLMVLEHKNVSDLMFFTYEI